MSIEENAPSAPWNNTAYQLAASEHNKTALRKRRRHTTVKTIAYTVFVVLCIVGIRYTSGLLLSSRETMHGTADLPSALVIIMATLGGILVVGSLVSIACTAITGVMFYSELDGINLETLPRIMIGTLIVTVATGGVTVAYLALLFYR